jgi:type I restriction enzyme S subunit
MSEDVTLDEFADSGEFEETDTGKPTQEIEKKPVREMFGIGRIPREWSIQSLADSAKIIAGSSPPSSTYNEKKTGLPFFQGNAEFGHFHPEPDTWCSEPRKVAEPDDILISIRAPVGDLNIADQRCCIGRGLAALRPNDTSRLYLYYHLTERKNWLSRLATGSTFNSVTKGDLQNLDIPLPPLSEQRKIATVLHTVDQAIQKTEEIIERVSRIKKGFKQDVFAEGYFDHQSHQESQIGKIPESWRIESAADLCDGITVGIVTGATDSYVSPSEGVPFIRSQDVHENHIEQDSLKYISKEFHEQQNSSELCEGDVITVRTGEPGTSCVIPPELDGANCFSLIISRPKKEVNEGFYNYYINSEKALDFIDSWKAGGVQDNFNVGVMERLPVPVPTTEEQQAIVDSLDEINERLESERQYREGLQRLKRSLMQDLLCGKVRTTNTNIEVPEEVAKYG